MMIRAATLAVVAGVTLLAFGAGVASGQEASPTVAGGDSASTLATVGLFVAVVAIAIACLGAATLAVRKWH